MRTRTSRRSWAAAIAASALITVNAHWLTDSPPVGTALRVALSVGSLVVGLVVLLLGLRQARRCRPA